MSRWKLLLGNFILSCTLAGTVVANAYAHPCTPVTRAAVQAVITTIEASQQKAQVDDELFGPEAPTPGTYAIAARYNRQGIETALAKMHDLLSWLDELGITEGYESYPAVAYHIYLSTWEPGDNLRWGRHWGAISAVYHTSADAKASTEITSEAIAQLETLGADATACYVSAWLP